MAVLQTTGISFDAGSSSWILEEGWFTSSILYFEKDQVIGVLYSLVVDKQRTQSEIWDGCLVSEGGRCVSTQARIYFRLILRSETISTCSV